MMIAQTQVFFISLLVWTGQGALISNPDKLWRGGKLYYMFDDITLDPASPTNRMVRDGVEQSMAYIQGKAPCISFINVATLNQAPRDYVKIVRGSLPNPCVSMVGKQGGEQQCGLGPVCFPRRSDGTLVLKIAIHVLFHSLGYTNEMNRPDRDKHITLDTNNIMEGYELNFEKRNYSDTDAHDEWSADDVDPKQTPYDRSSVMQYSPNTFANNPNEPVFTFNFDNHDYDGQDWPIPPPEDPMTVIDQVELLLGYRAEANCTIGEDLLVDYIHINRIALDLQIEDNNEKIENLTTRFDTMMEMIEKERKKTEALQNLVSALESSISK